MYFCEQRRCVHHIVVFNSSTCMKNNWTYRLSEQIVYYYTTSILKSKSLISVQKISTKLNCRYSYISTIGTWKSWDANVHPCGLASCNDIPQLAAAALWRTLDLLGLSNFSSSKIVELISAACIRSRRM